MSTLANKRIIISGLVSSKVALEDILVPIRNEIVKQNGIIVGELVQRRGVSRSKNPGGSKNLDLPLNSKTYISPGKVDELKDLCQELNAHIVIFINDLTTHQLNSIEEILELKVQTIVLTK